MPLDKMDLLTVLGPTASGKTRFAALLADKLDGEIISADSRQVYRGMTLGTGKDIEDYRVNGNTIPYHLIDIVDAGYKYNVFEFQKDFLRVYKDIVDRGKIPIMCGGSGMYIEAVTSGYTLIRVPENTSLREELNALTIEELTGMLASFKKLHNITDTVNRKRLIRAIEIETRYRNHPEALTGFPQLVTLFIGIKYDRVSRRKRISERLHQRLKGNMIEEVEELLKKLSPAQITYYGLEYKYITKHILGELSYEEMYHKLETAIHQFAKRQMTWFRKMERNGTRIYWLDGHQPMEGKLERALQIISDFTGS